MDYWSKRKIELDKSLEKDEELLKKRLSAYYDKEQTKLEKEIASFYARYGNNNILAYRNLLVSMEPEDVALLMERMDEFFVKYPDYAKLMPVRKYIYKLNRLEGLQYSIYLQQQEIGAVTNEALTVHLAKQAEKYGKAAATAIGHGTIFNAVNKSVAETFVITDWAAGKNYSQRIWENANKLAQYLNTDFAQGVARGDSYQKLITNLKDRFANVTRRDAFRLVYTEGTYVMNEASIRVFEEQYDEYEFSPINDEKTCSVCSSLKGQRFLISDRQAGVNFPPMHPYCRCSFTILLEKTVKQNNVANSNSKYYNNTDTDTNIPVTSETIESLKNVHIDGLNEEQCNIAFEQRKRLLREIKNMDTGIEGSVSFNLDGSEISPIKVGTYGQTGIYESIKPYYAIHNHPDNGVLSPPDIYKFLSMKELTGLESVGNNGKICAIVKSSDSNISKYKNYLERELKQYISENENYKTYSFELLNEFSKSLLEEGKKYGFKITITE